MNTTNKQEQEYIQDGLIMYLDCLDTANCGNGYWKDPVHNIIFNGNSQFSEKGFKFNGPNSGTYLISNTTFMNNILSNMKCTAEIVAESQNFTTWGFLLGDGDFGDLELMITISIFDSSPNTCTWAYKPVQGATRYTNGYRFSIPDSKESLTNKKFTISEAFGGKDSTLKYGFYNLQQMPFLNSLNSDATHRTNKLTIGNRNGGRGYTGTGTFSGYIKCVRLYNRQLSKEEILYNQSIDNIKYNLGL